MTIADAGQADWNSTDSCTDGGTSSRVIGSNPNFGKKRSAVVVKRNTAPARWLAARRSAASVSSMAEPLALTDRIDSDRPEQGAVVVELQRCRPDDVSVFPGDEHGLHVVIDALERQTQSLEQRVDLGQVPVRRGFDHGCDSCARGAQHAPPAGLSST